MPSSVTEALELIDRLRAADRADRAGQQMLLAELGLRLAQGEAALGVMLDRMKQALAPPPPLPSMRGPRSGMWCRWGSFYPQLPALESLQLVDGKPRPCDDFSIFGVAGTVGALRGGLYKDQVAAVAPLVAQGLHCDVAVRSFPTAGNRPSAWPARLGNSDLISPTNPPGTGTPTRLDAVDVWRARADGFFDELHRAQVRAIRQQLGGSDLELSFRFDWEGDAAWEPLSTHSINSCCWSCLESDAEIALFHAAQARLRLIIEEECGERGALFFCPLKNGKTRAPVLDYANPDACGLVGLDYYDMWPACRSPADYELDNPASRINARRANRSPAGLGAWLDDYDSRLRHAWRGRAVRGVRLGEWGVVFDAKDPAGTYTGQDNPLFVEGVLSALWRHRKIVVGTSYFSNKDGAFLEHRLQAAPGGRHPNASAAYGAGFQRLWRWSQQVA